MKILVSAILLTVAASCHGAGTKFRARVDEYVREGLICLGNEPTQFREPWSAWKKAEGKLDIIKRSAPLVEAMWKQGRRSEKNGAAGQAEKYRVDSSKYLKEVVADVDVIQSILRQLASESGRVKQLASEVRIQAESDLRILDQKKFPEEEPNHASQPTPGLRPSVSDL